MKNICYFFILWFLPFWGAAQQYALQPSSSTLQWTGRAAYSTYSLSGTLKAKAGTLKTAAGKVAQAQLLIDMQSLSSDIGQLTMHLHSGDFFEVNRYREATFILEEPFPLQEGAGTAQGKLTIKAVTKEATLPFTLRREGRALVLEGVATIDRTAYGIYYNSPNFFKNLKQEAIADTFDLAFRLVFEPEE